MEPLQNNSTLGESSKGELSEESLQKVLGLWIEMDQVGKIQAVFKNHRELLFKTMLLEAGNVPADLFGLDWTLEERLALVDVLNSSVRLVRGALAQQKFPEVVEKCWHRWLDSARTYIPGFMSNWPGVYDLSQWAVLLEPLRVVEQICWMEKEYGARQRIFDRILGHNSLPQVDMVRDAFVREYTRTGKSVRTRTDDALKFLGLQNCPEAESRRTPGELRLVSEALQWGLDRLHIGNEVSVLRDLTQKGWSEYPNRVQHLIVTGNSFRILDLYKLMPDIIEFGEYASMAFVHNS
jgi:hypothetical protein